MTNEDSPTRQIEPELLQRLGKLVIRWSEAEQLVEDLFIWATGGERGSLYVVTKNVSIGSISGWLRTLADVKDTPQDLHDELADLLGEFDVLRGERNALVHGLWGTDESPPGTAMVQTTRLERQEIVRDVLVTPAELDDLIRRIIELGANLRKLRVRYAG